MGKPRGKPSPNRLRVWRAERHLTQLLLGRKSGVSPTRISFIENCLVDATDAERKHLAKALKVEIAEVFPEAEALAS